MKRLLFITPIFPCSEKDDTIVPFVYQFTKYYSQKYSEIKIDVLTLYYPVAKESYKIDNITIHPLGIRSKKKRFYLLGLFKGCLKIYSLQKKNNYQGVLSFWYGKTALMGQLLSFFFKIKHFCWLQGQDVKPSNPYFKLFRLKPSKLITVGINHQALLNKFQNLANSTVANVAITPKNFPSLNQNKREIDIIGIGNLGTIKNYSLFIDVIYEIKKQLLGKPLKVVICGDGEEKQYLQNKIYNLGLENEIQLLGYVSNIETLDLLNNSKLFLHTSVFEGNPMVIQEALYSGCKVVSTFDIRVDKNPVTNFNYYLDKVSLCKKVKELLFTSEISYKRVHQNKIEDTCKTIHSLYF